jgi:uncharacterized membrane-anchored protein YhcB (DUF1043 family)
VVTRRVQAILLLAACALLSACATLTQLAYSNAAMAYNNLPPMISWWVDDYVDMSGGQKDWVRDRIERAMQWHRSHELPEYRHFFEHVLAESREPFTVEEIAQAYRDLRKHYHRTVEQLLPDIADFFLQLDAEQAAQMEKKFASDNRKFARESVKGTPEERTERRAKRFAGHMEGWLGSVSHEQRDMIESYYRGIPDLIEERLADRKVRHIETLSLIRSRPGKEEMVAGLRRLLIDTETWRRPEYVKKLADRDQRFFEMISRLSASLSPAQRAYLQRRIRGFMRDITTLTASS